MRASDVSAPDSPTFAVGDVLHGRLAGTAYQVEEELGAGGVGTVYRVTRKSSGEIFALKVLHRGHANSDALRRRFEREAQALGALAHPNVVGIVDYGTAKGGEPYLVMELLEGESLSQRLRRQPLDAGEVRKYAGELLAAIAYVHREGLIHRDLKPGNVFLHRRPDGSVRAKVLDFGFAKFVEAGATAGDPLTRTGEIFGTPAYMSPEQIGSEQTNARTDVYALGVMLFEMITVRKPFEGDLTDVLRGHLVEAPPSVAEACPGLEVCPGLEPLITRALRKRPTERFAHAGEMLAAFEDLPDPLFGSRRSASSITALGRAPTIAQSKASDSAARAVRRSIALSAVGAWFLALFRTAVTTGAVALIVLSLAVILLSGFAIYELRRAKPTGDRSDATLIADALASEVQAAKRSIEATSAAIRRELSQLSPQDAGPSTAHGSPASAERPPARDPWHKPAPRALRSIMKTAEAGGRGSEGAIGILRDYNRKHPGDARGHLVLARLYWNRGWKKDALAQYELAARSDPAARGASGMLERLIELIARPATAGRAADLVAALYGAEALDAVTQALRRPPRDAGHRARLEALRARLSRAR